jgi:heptaprenyl diphosphate synthase
MKSIALKKIALAGILSALSLIAHVIESLFPPLLVPGARLGISNVFILLGLILLGKGYSFVILGVKVVLGSLFSGHFDQIIYALPAGIISLSVQITLFVLINKISLVAISVVGGTLHITIQNVIFCILTNTAEYLTYLPYLALTGVIAGLAVGLAVYTIIKFLPQKLFKGIIS